MATLPYDIIVTEILPKLPAKSLLRFKRVCKSFNTQISCPEFINLHLRQGLSNKSNRFLILIDHFDLMCMDMYSPKSPMFTLNPRTDFYDPGFFNFWRPLYNSKILIVGSCNGLLCITNASRHATLSIFLLLNPCTGVSLMIPHFEELTKGYSSLISANFGFGFDSIENDYKIVSILDYVSDYYEVDFLRRDVLVYSFNNANKSWRLALSTSSPNKGLLKHHQNGVPINNHLLHWMFSCSDNEYRIGCFDLESENWVNDVPLPEFRQKISTQVSNLLFDYYGDIKYDELQLSVLDSYLCLSTENLNDITFDVWAMKEYGVRESWVKLFGILDSFVDKDFKLCALGYHGAEENEILVTRVGKIDDADVLLFYNVQDKTVTSSDQRLRSPGGDFIDACICHGSLVTL